MPRLPGRSKSAADTTLSLKDPPLDVAGQKNFLVIVKISINGKELTRSRGYQIRQT